ncbi:MAG TPA: hypothetical protein VFT64_04345 [Rickettsiales bacterium]|nr:hypothetical protein [Rickettsiales bacterium]
MVDSNIEPGTVCYKIIKTFLDEIAGTTGFEKVAGKLEEAILDQKPTEALIRAALFDEEIS